MDLTQTVRGSVLQAREDGVTDYLTDDGAAFFRSQDVTEILRINAAERNGDTMKGFRIAPTMRKVASIPVAAVDIAAAQGIDLLHDADALRRFLNDPENRAFRTTMERV